MYLKWQDYISEHAVSEVELSELVERVDDWSDVAVVALDKVIHEHNNKNYGIVKFSWVWFFFYYFLKIVCRINSVPMFHKILDF